jgi:hypothetical protein
MFKWAALLVISELVSAPSFAQMVHGKQKMVIDSDEFHYVATFDSARISEARLRDLLIFSPYDLTSTTERVDGQQTIVGYEETADRLRKGPLAYPLEQCVDKDPQYRPCGTRDISDPNFFANAQINLNRNEQILTALHRLNVPAELNSILRQFIDSMTFYSEMESRRLQYLQMGDLKILSLTISNLDPSKICAKEVGKLEEAGTMSERYDLSRREWLNCLNLEWNRVSPAYPKAAWLSFLHAFGISEKYSYKPVD